MSRLLQGTPSPVFDTVAALMANYAAVNRRVLGERRPTVPVVIPARPAAPVTDDAPNRAPVAPAADPNAGLGDDPVTTPALVLDADGRVIHRRDALGPPAPVGQYRPGVPRDVDRIIGAVAAMHGQTMDDVLGRSLMDGAVMARMDAIAAVRVCFPDMPRHRIGRIFGRDQTTILNALARRGLATTARVSSR